MLQHIRPVAVATSLLVLLGVGIEAQQPCASVLTPSYAAPVVAAGFSTQLVTQKLFKPRGIIFDKEGALLVVQAKSGITRLTFSDGGGTCLGVTKSTTLVQNSALNHGIEISEDGKTLYASSSNEVFSWAYDSANVSVSNQRTLIRNMTNSDHVTRTLLLSRKVPGMMLVSRGSGENIDMLATNEESGISQIRAFNLTALQDGQVYDYPSQGVRLGWGLRNSVGVAEHPVTGGIYSVENSADQIRRSEVDIHQDNPGEELNFHGYLNGTSGKGDNGNYGYPDCFALWSTKDFPDLGRTIQVGSQFSLNTRGSNVDDAGCANDYIAPRLTFQAHTAPLDIKFNANGSLAYVTFHGSWNRDQPAGYKLSVISFKDGEPTEPSNSTTAVIDILTNPNLSACPNGCFRPVGLALDSQGRIFMSSDSTGEIYVLQQQAGATLPASGTGTGGGGSATSSAAAAGLSVPWRSGDGYTLLVAGLLGVVSFVLGGGSLFAVSRA
ncbi:soluble quino protein glucose/sorbosone dehydrogenase [Podospora didyma]|uniref:Soluble quino protein glucose/sorbosone dehydrogenase n=1 Tax=Podospora didyma TaxID=330526 RepID=A0AAE0NHB1_9PEZI|nr:soluble quino protein glucose/sorbosone dehydrogenase [Podospora didyma]